LNNVRSEDNRYFRNKMRAYLEVKYNELETNSKNKNIRDKLPGYQPRTFIAKDDKGDLVADSHSILVRWRNHFSSY
jgi:hypothetical protein